MLNVTLAPAAARVLAALARAASDRAAAVRDIVTAESGLLLLNDIGTSDPLQRILPLVTYIS